MTTTPTPDEARRALNDVHQRRQQAADAGGWGRGWWIGAGVATAALGVLFDFKGDELGDWTNVIVLALLALTVLSTTRRGGALTGRSVRPRQPGPARWLFASVFAVLIVVVSLLVGTLSIAHIGTIVGVVGGLVLALAGPWWQNRVLARQASRP